MRVLDFADQFEASVEPTRGTLLASGLAVHADDAAFVTAKGSAAADGDAYVNSTDGRIHYYQGSWRLGARVSDLDEHIGSGRIGEAADFTINDAEATPTNVTGLVLNGDNHVSGIVEYQVIRSTTIHATGILKMHYRNSTWVLVDGGFDGDFHGVTFTIDQTGSLGQIQYTSDGSGAGTMKFRVRTFDA